MNAPTPRVLVTKPNRYAAPDNGGDSVGAYLAMVSRHSAVWATTPGSIPRPLCAGLSPIPNSLGNTFSRVLVPIIAVSIFNCAAL